MSTDLVKLRKNILKMVFHANEGHIPSAFSILEIVYSLYAKFLKYDPKDPKSDDRDYFILSKGHAGAAQYAVLAHFGFFDERHLLDYCKPISFLGGHPDAKRVPGVEVSSGSLGHGISMAVGLSMALKIKKKNNKVVVLVGDGEMDEGTFWESIYAVKNLGLTNFMVIADCNNSQKYSYKFDYKKILAACDWEVIEVDGHSLPEIEIKFGEFFKAKTSSRPLFVKANTIKGFGVARLVGDHAWHRRTPTELELTEMLGELER